MNRVIKTSAPRSDSPVSPGPAARAGGPTLTRPAPAAWPTVHVVRRRRRAGRGQPALGDQESVVRREKDGAGARRITLSTSGTHSLANMKVSKKGTGNTSAKRNCEASVGRSDPKSVGKSKDHKCVDKSEQSDSRVGGTGSGWVVSSEGQPGPATISSKSPNVHGLRKKSGDDVNSSKGLKRKSSDNIVPNTTPHVTKSGNAKKKKSMKDKVMCCDILSVIRWLVIF